MTQKIILTNQVDAPTPEQFAHYLALSLSEVFKIIMARIELDDEVMAIVRERMRPEGEEVAT